MDAAGSDDVFLETVGVGQAEVDVIDHADSVVLVLIPGSGDSIQALKAGVMEIPDIIVVNKADHPLTDTMVREIRGVLSLAPRRATGACRSSRPRRPGPGRRGAGGEARRAPRARRGGGPALRAPPPQPDERGPRPRHACGCAGRSRPRCATTRRSRSCSTRSSRGGSIRRARRARCSSAARSTRPTPRAAPDAASGAPVAAVVQQLLPAGGRVDPPDPFLVVAALHAPEGVDEATRACGLSVHDLQTLPPPVHSVRTYAQICNHMRMTPQLVLIAPAPPARAPVMIPPSWRPTSTP